MTAASSGSTAPSAAARTSSSTPSPAASSASRVMAPALGVPFPAALDEGLRLFKAVVTRPEISLDFMLEPGEMIWLNSLTTIHARTSFVDSPTHKRLLLRLWLNPHAGEARPVTPALRARVAAYEWHFAEQKRLRRLDGRAPIA